MPVAIAAAPIYNANGLLVAVVLGRAVVGAVDSYM